MSSDQEAPVRTRGRAQLSRESILDAAKSIAADGDQITFRALGSALDADPTAVYRHFRDKDELVRGVFDLLLVDVSARVDDERPWRDQLHQLAQLTWDACEAHPSVGLEAHSLTTGGPGELACVELFLVQLTRAGLGQGDAVRYYAVLSNYVLSVASTKAAYRLKTRDSAADWTASWLGDLAPVSPREFPQIAQARVELAALRDEEIFSMGLDVILDAAAAAAAKPAAAT
jgi:AcrR family transcriptional regulator